MTTFNQANCTCTQEHIDPSCEVHGGATLKKSLKVGDNSVPATNGQDFGWLDATLNSLVADHIDIPSMDKESGLAWVDDYRTTQAAIIKRFTAQEQEWSEVNKLLCEQADKQIKAQAKHHQIDLLKARIAELKMVDPIASHKLAVTVDDRLDKLKADLAKLEGESV